MAKTKSKRAVARQAVRVREQHNTTFEDKVLRRPNPEVRRAAQKKQSQSGFAGFVNQFPVLTGILTIAILASIVSILATNRLGPFAPPTKPVADACAWAKNPATFKVTGAVQHTYSQAPKNCIIKTTGGSFSATIHTAKGDIVMELDQSQAPITVNNFVFLATHHFYDNMSFHRVVTDFVIQAGDPRTFNNPTYDTTKAVTDGSDGPGYSVANEYPQNPGFFNQGCVAMANKGSGTTGSQFFICTADNSSRLQNQYNWFGRIESGLAVAQQIQQNDVIQSITIHLSPTGVPGVYDITPTVAPAAPTVTATP